MLPLPRVVEQNNMQIKEMEILNMKNRLLTALLSAGLLLNAVPVFAHHSFSSEFDINQPITLDGTLTKLDWVNPHGFIYLDVKGADGKVVNWAVETGSPNALLRRGVRKSDFIIGSKIVVRGFRAKSGLPVANGRAVKLADGRDLFAGSSGTGAPRDKADPSEQY
jgi:hypothetical protein